MRWALPIRPPEASPIVLGHRRVYVLPTAAGLGFAALLPVMFAAAVNYGLSLGHALVFLLAGLGVSAMLHAYRNLRGLVIRPSHVESVFAGETVRFQVLLHSDGGRPALRLWLPCGGHAVLDLPADTITGVTLPCKAEQRGWFTLPRIGIESRYPLGLVRAWAYCAPASRCLVFPRPASEAPPLPLGEGAHGGVGGASRGSDDFAGLRGHQPADPPRHVAWKNVARLGLDAVLLTKHFDGDAMARVRLDWDSLAGRDDETRLSILTRWALQAHEAGLAWGLSLPGRTIAPGQGDRHLHSTLKALALHGTKR